MNAKISKILVIIDTKGLEYALVDSVNNFGLKSYEAIERMTQVTLAAILSGAVYSSLEVNSEVQFLFVDDTKPYWREYELAKLGIAYKGKRKKGTLRVDLLNIICTQVEYILNKYGIKILKQALPYQTKCGQTLGYEADDLAAFTVRQLAPKFDKVYICTSDTDWLPLTSIYNVYWFNLYNYAPRIRNERLALEWWNNNATLNNTKIKKAFEKTKIIDIWRFKALFGDYSDNLPANCKHNLLPFIDLWEPLTQYDLTQHLTLSEMSKHITAPRSAISLNNFWQIAPYQQLGVMPYTYNDVANLTDKTNHRVLQQSQ